MIRSISKYFVFAANRIFHMNQEFAGTAALLSDPARASMLMALLGGASLPAGQLAMIANVSPQTAGTLSLLQSGPSGGGKRHRGSAGHRPTLRECDRDAPLLFHWYSAPCAN